MDSVAFWDAITPYLGEAGLAGLVGATGNQVLYWGNRLRRAGGLRLRVLIFSFLYIMTGSGVGHFVGVDGGSALLALGAGFGWPAFIQSINAAKQVGQRFLGGEGRGEGEQAPQAGG